MSQLAAFQNCSSCNKSLNDANSSGNLWQVDSPHKDNDSESKANKLLTYQTPVKNN